MHDTRLQLHDSSGRYNSEWANFNTLLGFGSDVRSPDDL
jgi:hypothetical protein